MAGTNLLALIDDIATLLDDISIYSKIAAKKTAGVLGDDLALNAEQVTGIKVTANYRLALLLSLYLKLIAFYFRLNNSFYLSRLKSVFSRVSVNSLS